MGVPSDRKGELTSAVNLIGRKSNSKMPGGLYLFISVKQSFPWKKHFSSFEELLSDHINHVVALKVNFSD